jgi:GNAT superfamily N-acetyltransferase
LPAGLAHVIDSTATIRRATLADVDDLTRLIALSARELGRAEYDAAQIEGALRGAFGVDTQLIRDGSFFIVEANGRMAGCGGWSRRRTLFGGDGRADPDAAELDPATEAAKIGAFFVHPDFARRGLASMMLERCEHEATMHGFTRLEMMATLPGMKLYAARGYLPGERVDWPLGSGLSIPFVRMSKDLPPTAISIGTAADADAAEILALQKLAYESEARLYRDWSLPPLTQALDSLRAELASTVILKACMGEKLVGSVRAAAGEGKVRIGRLIVHPGSQGRGIGTLLMRAIESRFPGARFELFTGSRSERNLRLYERLGYRRVREQVSSGVTLVFLEKQA